MQGSILVLLVHYIFDLMLKKWYERLDLSLHAPNKFDKGVGIRSIQLYGAQDLIKRLSILR